MKKPIIWAVFCTALSICGMHVSSDEEPKKRKSIEMINFALKPPATNLNASYSRNSNPEEQIEYKPV